MKLHRLELTGFGPFLQTQSVDFDAFDDDGVFLISGRTGAGKSSILDGVSFALYGSVPRYDGGDRRLRSDHCAVVDATEVRLEFTVGDRRWRVTRAPEYERPAKRGGGLTTETARAELEELVDGGWIGRAAKPRDVAIELDEILGLNAQQFQQVILLAQNKFSRFLLASNAERQSLLRTLFGTRRFEQYKDDLEQRRRDAQKALDAVGERARTLLDQAERVIREHELGAVDEQGEPLEYPADLGARRAAAARALQRADYRVEQAATAQEQADAAHLAATAAHAALSARAQRSAERIAARTRLAELEESAGQIAEDRVRLQRARAAEALRAPLEAAERAIVARDAAGERAAAAEQAWRDAAGSGVDDDAATVDLAGVDLAGVDLAGLIERLTGDLARWQPAADQEAALTGNEQRLAEEAGAIADQEAALAALDEQQALVPAQRAQRQEALAAAGAAAARLDDAHRRRDVLVTQSQAARDAAALASEASTADAVYAAANAAAAAAVAAVTSLLQRRLAGFAGELSAALAEGEPCAVCGSCEHPHPAEPTADPITDDDLAAAEAARDAATAAERDAAEAARTVRDTLAAARERAGGHDLETLQTLLVQAEADAATAESAVTDVARLTAELAELDTLAAAVREEHERLAATLSAAREERSARAAEVARQQAEVAAARGSFASVAERLAAVTAQRQRAQALAESRSALAERERALTDALADRDARLAASVFARDGIDGADGEVADTGDSGMTGDAGETADSGHGTADTTTRAAEAAVDALLPESARAALDTRIAAHTADVTAVRARLLELELDIAADDVSADDLAASEAALADADAARTGAIAARRDAQNTADRLRDLLVQTDDAYATVAAVADDAAVITRLADTVAGRAPNTMKMELETFVLAAELEEIVAAANLRLEEMSSGRYTLHHTDAKASRGRASGLGIEVLDAHTGRLRSPQSLSGGETFLASLALALGLAEVVTSRAGGLRLDTLFVDEGFGSLDPETLELAMRTLDELRAGGRTVGVISHVEAMKEQLPAQVVVTATPEGPSIIAQAA